MAKLNYIIDYAPNPQTKETKSLFTFALTLVVGETGFAMGISKTNNVEK